jgi:outer membrane protein TolC
VALAPACVAARPNVDPLAALASATAVESALVVRVECAPLDEPARVPDRLGLAEALRLSLAASPALQAALARVRAAEAEADLSRLLPNPVLDLALRFPSGGGRTEVDVGVAQDLVRALARPRRSRAADNRLAQSVAELVTVALDLVADVRCRYVAAQAAERELGVLVQRRALLERLLAAARARLEQGEASALDLSGLELQSLGLELEQRRVASERRGERLALARLLGRPSREAEWSLDPWSPPATLGADEGTWIARAAARPEIRALEAELAARREEAGLAGPETLAGTGAGLDAELRADISLGPAFSAPVPVFDRAGPRRARAEAHVVEARHELVELRRRIVEEVRQALERRAAAEERLALVRDSVSPLAARRRQLAESAFLAGESDVTALLAAEQALTETELERIDAEAEVARAWIQLERAAGGAAAASGERASNMSSAEDKQ